MTTRRGFGTGLLAFCAAVPLGTLPLTTRPAAAETTPRRIVSIGGAVTEIVFALGQQHRLAARDTTSTFPPEAELLPDVGYIRQLSPEGVLSVSPDMILAEEGAGPPETVDLLESAGLPFVIIPQGYDEQAIHDKITAVGAALGVEDAAGALAENVRHDISAAQAVAGNTDKSVMFILSNQGGRIMASGAGTAADGIIRMAGARNAFADFQGYKILTDEAIAAAEPDVILMMSGAGSDHDTAIEDLIANPAIATTPAARNRAIIRMDAMYLLGFSVRTADALRDLTTSLRQVGG